MGNLARDVLFRMPSFCLLIVRYMLSDKIKGKSALKARTFLHVVRDKVHACYWYSLSMHLSTENSAGYLRRVQIFLKPFIGEIFTFKDKDYCPIQIIKGLADKGQFQYLTKLMGPQVGNYLYTTQFLSLR